MSDSPLMWIVNTIQLPKEAPWDFESRPWQIDIIEDERPHIVCQKPTQIGMSTVFLCKMLYFADKHSARLMYTLPRQDDVFDMVNTRLKDIVDNSPYLTSRIGSIDNVRIKQLGKSWLHFAEMSVPPRMLDTDWLLNDEVDLSNQNHVAQTSLRLDASKWAIHHKISTPTIDQYGINALFLRSDQKEWIVECQYCLHEQPMIWEVNMGVHRNRAQYICARCHNPLTAQDIMEGRWLPMSPGHDTSGYHISHMIAPNISPQMLWDEYNSPLSTHKDFYNFRLGMPYTSKSTSFEKDTIMRNCFSTYHSRLLRANNSSERYVLGCDQGNTLNVCVGRIVGTTVEVVFAEEVEFEQGFGELENIIRRFNVEVAFVDALPNHHSAINLAHLFENRMYVAYFSMIDSMLRVNEEEQKVSIYKVDAYDALVQAVNEGSIQFYGSADGMDSQITKVVQQMSNMRRDLQTQHTRAGGVKSYHVWRAVGPDHYADAMVYMYLASRMLLDSTARLDVLDIDEYINMVRSGMDVQSLNDSLDTLMGGESSLKVVPPSRLSGIKMKPELQPDNPYVLARQDRTIGGLL